MSVKASPAMGTNVSILLDRREAWHYVMQWAKGDIEFVPLTKKLEELGDYNPEDWKVLFQGLFNYSEDDDVLGAIATVEKAMQVRGIYVSDLSADTNQGTGLKHQGSKTRRDSEDLPSPKRQRVLKKGKPAQRVSRFLDLEAQDVTDDDESEEDERDATFIAPDNEDGPVAGPSSLRSNIYPSVPLPGPSRYNQAIDAISQRYVLNYGLGDDEESEEEGDPDLEELDVIGIWNTVGKWLRGTLNFEILMKKLDFQHGKYAKIGYWEDLVSTLAFEKDLDKREEKFNAISLPEHHRRLTAYESVSIKHPLSRDSLSLSPPLGSSNVAGHTLLWFVRIVPASSAKYIAGMWSKAGLKSTTIEGLPGRISVLAPNPKTLFSCAPPSHIDCIRSFTRVPAEETLFHTMFGGSRTIPTWCIITKRGRYKGDLGYVIAFNQESGLLDVLVASRDLSPPPRHLNDNMIGEDLRARRLFSQECSRSVESTRMHGRPTFIFQKRCYISGLLLLQLPETQVRVLLTPTPHQIALHVRSGIDPSFMDDTRRRYHQMFWKPLDRVMLNDASHFQLLAKLVSVDLENHSAVVESILEMEHLVVPLAALDRVYQAGDLVRLIIDPCSDHQNVHHKNIGRFGLITEVDSSTGEVTFLDHVQLSFRAPPYLLESYLPDRPLPPSMNITGEIDCDIQIGDSALVLSGPFKGYFGTVEVLSSTVASLRPLNPSYPTITVDTQSAVFQPPASALSYSAERGYNVRFGDAVIVVRGRWLGKRGIVGAVDLDKKILEVNARADGERFLVPITHVTHENQMSEHDETQRYVGKDVLVIRNHYKGWRGTLRNVSRDKCAVAPGNAACVTLNKNDVVVKGCNSTLSGLLLTHPQLLHVAAAFRRSEIPDQSTRQKTPPPSPLPSPSYIPSIAADSSTDAWTVNPDDIVRSPPLTKLDFMLRPEVRAVLQTHHAIFKIDNTWRAGYVNRCCRTDVPDPFQSESGGGALPSSHLAVSVTSRGAGGRRLFENIHEKYLEPYPPSKGSTYCMVIKARQGGEGEAVGTVLSVTRSSRKGMSVSVARTDNSSVTEPEITWDRVIEVEVATSR